MRKIIGSLASAAAQPIGKRDSGSRWGPLGHRCRGPVFKKLGLKPSASARLTRAACFARSTVWGPHFRAQ